MQYAYAILLLLTCLLACARPVWAVVLLMYLFPIEQVMQSVAPILRTTVLGNQLINYLVGVVAIVAAGNTVLRKPICWLGLPSRTLLFITLLLAWSLVTLLWSPGRALGGAVVAGSWPYYVIVLLGTFIICDLEDVRELATGLVLLGIALCTVILVSPEFSSQSGRLGIFEAGRIQSNPLAIGDLGGMTLIAGALMRRNALGALAVPLRIAAVVLGSAIAIKSGSRGQFMFAVGIATLFFPLAAPVRSVATFFSTAIGIAVIGAVVLVVSNILLEGVTARRFSSEAIIYGASSTYERLANVVGLGAKWISSPIHIVVGLGYYAYSSFGYGADFSHVVAADALFELGLPGALLYVSMLVLVFRAAKGLLRIAADDPLDRSAAALVVALLAYQFLLSNKQGELWGIMSFFMLACIVTRLEIRYSRWPSGEAALAA